MRVQSGLASQFHSQYNVGREGCSEEGVLSKEQMVLDDVEGPQPC